MESLGHGSRYGSWRNRPMRSSSKSSGRSIPIPLEPLKEGHRIDPQERLFLEAAEKGDRHTMVRCLMGPNKFNVNCTNILGRSALQIAVDNENIEIVELLLKQEKIKIGDALLFAIQEGVYRIVEMLIDHPSITRGMLGSEWSKTKVEAGPGEQSSEFSPDISPVILAATCNQFEILQLLLSRGAKIENPHILSCTCKRCNEQANNDGLRHSLLRIHTFRALSSPAWISLTSSDPILTAFKLSWDLAHLAMKENEFKDMYLDLSESCKKYACDLLDQCRSSEEVIAVLNRDDNSDFDDDDVDEENLTLERLKLALKYEQKQFVAHPHCQQLLTSIWYNGLPGWRKRNTFLKFLTCCGLICVFPFMVINYLLMPKSALSRILRSPFMKFLYHSTSFATFLSLLLSMNWAFESDRSKSRGPKPNSLEWLILLWVLGFVWAEVKQIWEEGLKAYVRQWWNWLDFIMLSLYLCTFSLRLVAYVQIHFFNADNTFGEAFLSRERWPADDPTIISEGLFAMANVFSFARIIFLFQANPHLGPLQISLGCMLIDIAKFMFIFFLVLTSFACGLNQLYSFYREADKSTSSPFSDLSTNIKQLLWSIFGFSDLAILNGANQAYVAGIGTFLYGIYHFVAIIILTNMLIAMMSSTLQEVEDHADREWKFARSKLWMGYFDEGSTLPPPFNLIISPKAVYYLLRGCKNIICYCVKKTRRDRVHRKSSNGSIKSQSCNGDGAATSELSLKFARPRYQEVMRRLVSRYIHETKKMLRQDGVSEDDLLEIKQDISSLRYELREDRKREAAKAASQMESIKRDILRNLVGVTNSNGGHRSEPENGPNVTLPHSSSGSILSQSELEFLKREIIQGVRMELREISMELAQQQAIDPGVGGGPMPNMLPPSNDLYHTHLYTQL